MAPNREALSVCFGLLGSAERESSRCKVELRGWIADWLAVIGSSDVLITRKTVCDTGKVCQYDENSKLMNRIG